SGEEARGVPRQGGAQPGHRRRRRAGLPGADPRQPAVDRRALARPEIRRHARACARRGAGLSVAHRIFSMPFARVYLLYVKKAEAKGRTKAEVDEIIRWLTGYDQAQLQRQVD